MSTPTIYGGLGISGNGSGTLGLGGPQPSQSSAFSPLPATALPYIAHLYDHNLKFKKTLGPLSNKPALKMTLNGGYQQITIRVPAEATTGLPVYGKAIYGFDTYGGSIASLGDVIRLSEQGDSNGTILFSGNVEDTPDEIVVGGQTVHAITLTPWVAELGDAYFDHDYTTPIDVANFVRDAVDQTAHCSISPISCPDTGVLAIYQFNNTTALDAVHVAKQIAGANWWWFVDAQGLVWFQAVATGNPARATIRRGVDYNSRKSSSSIVGMKNKIVVIGGPDPNTSYSGVILADNPVGYWTLGDASTTVVDQIHGNNGTAAGGVTVGIAGPIKSVSTTAMQFDGSTGVITVPTSTLLHPGDTFSLECWVNGAASPVPSGGLIATGSNDFEMEIRDGKLRFQKTGSTILMTSSTTVNNGQWRHVVWTKAGILNHMYIDGRDATPASVTNATIVAGSAGITFGKGTDITFLGGVLGQVAIYNYVLTPTQVAKHYATGISTGTGNLKATYSGTVNQSAFGIRAYNPTLVFPTVTDQATLNQIATNLGTIFDRIINSVEFVVPALPSRVTLGFSGGVTLRYWEPDKDSLVESEAGTGTYSNTFVVQDIEVNGIEQTILVGDLPMTGTQDVQYEVDRIVQRLAALHAALPPLTAKTTLKLAT